MRHTILLIEDSKSQADAMVPVLADAGYDVVWEWNGLQGFKRAKAVKPDVVLLDIVLPDYSGYEVCRLLKGDEETSHIPVIMLTVKSGVDDVVQGFLSEADDYVRKPFDPRELKARIEAALRHKTRIDDLKKMSRQMEQAARTDALTGLLSRLSLKDFLEVEFNRFRRYGSPLSCAFADIDRFKSINDSCGHGTGDKVLVEVAKAIRSCLRNTDLAARFGGDEFVLLFPETPPKDVRLPVERIFGSLRRSFISGDEPVIGVSVSVGIAGLPHSSIESAEDLLKAADTAMYKAKQSGGNCLFVFDETSQKTW